MYCWVKSNNVPPVHNSDWKEPDKPTLTTPISRGDGKMCMIIKQIIERLITIYTRYSAGYNMTCTKNTLSQLTIVLMSIQHWVLTIKEVLSGVYLEDGISIKKISLSTPICQ